MVVRFADACLDIEQGVTVLSGEALSLHGSDVSDSETDVKEWAASFIN